MQTTRGGPDGFCQEIPNAQNSQDTRRSVYRAIPRQTDAYIAGIWAKGISFTNCWSVRPWGE
jgi:hypothetical protein